MHQDIPALVDVLAALPATALVGAAPEQARELAENARQIAQAHYDHASAELRPHLQHVIDLPEEKEIRAAAFRLIDVLVWDLRDHVRAAA